MGKHKRKNRDYDDDLYRQVKKLKKSLKRKKRQVSEESLSDYYVPEDSCTITEPVLEQIVEAVPEQSVELAPVPTETEHVIETEPDELINEVLGEDPSKTNKYGENILTDLASRWEHITKESLQKDTKTEILKSILMPENCRFLEAPIQNPEIKAAISDPVFKRDRVLRSQQNLLRQATACVAVALNSMLKDNIRNIEITKTLSKAGRILCELFHMQSSARRSLIQFALNKETKDIVTETKIGTHLFGDNLGEALKAGKAIYKTGLEIRYPKPPPNKPNPKQHPSLNYRGPPRKPQQQRPPLPPSAGRTTQGNKQAPQRYSTQKTHRYRK